MIPCPKQPIRIRRLMPEVAGDDAAHTVARMPSTECQLAVSSMSRSNDRHPAADRSSTLLDFLSGGLRQLFIALPSSESFDAFEDVIVDVCLNLVRASIAMKESPSRTGGLAWKRGAATTAMHSMTSETIHLATTSTRIPVLSP